MVRVLRSVGGETGTASKEGQDVFEAEDAVILEKVQRGAELDVVIKDLEKELKTIKKELMTHAKEVKETEFATENGASLKINPSSKTVVESVKEFVRLLKRLDKAYMVDDLLKVEISKVKKILGEDVLEDVSVTTTEKFGKMSFKMIGRNLEDVKKSILS